MLRLGAEREALGVVSDQFGKPTSASEIARVTLDILPKADGKWGVYHLAQPEAVNWHGFAESIFAEATKQGLTLKIKQVKAISTKAYPTPAKRPVNSELACEKIEDIFGVEIQAWSKHLAILVKKLLLK